MFYVACCESMDSTCVGDGSIVCFEVFVQGKYTILHVKSKYLRVSSLFIQHECGCVWMWDTHIVKFHLTFSLSHAHLYPTLTKNYTKFSEHGVFTLANSNSSMKGLR